MIVKDIICDDFELACGYGGIDKMVNGVYLCDLLSFVISHAKSGNVWITIQTHINIVAVAVLTGISCIIIPESESIQNDTIEKANKENIPIFKYNGSSYDAAIKLYEMMK